jgi:hypothetical protein
VRSYRAKADSSSDPLVRTLRDVASGAADISEDVLGRLRDRFGRRGEQGGGAADPAG